MTAIDEKIASLYAEDAKVKTNRDMVDELRRSVEQGDLGARSRLIEILRNGLYGVPSNHSAAYDLAAEGMEQDDPNCTALYWTFRLNKDFPEKTAEAIKNLTPFVQEGNVHALAWLGAFYAFHVPVSKEEGIQMLQRAAELGDSYAIHHIALCLTMGNGVSKDTVAAYRLFQQLADQGYQPAMYELGVSFYYANGVAENKTLGKEWLRKACEAGHVEAYHLLRDIGKKESGVWYLGGCSVDTQPPAY